MKLLTLMLSILSILTAHAANRSLASGNCGRYGTPLRSNGSCSLCQTTPDADYRMWPMFYVARNGAEEFSAQSRRSDVEYIYNERVGSGVCERAGRYKQAEAEISEGDTQSAN